MTHVGIKEIFLPFLWKFTQHLASSGKTRFLHIRRTGTEGEEGEVQMGAGRGKKEPVTKGLSRAESPARGQHKAKWAGAEEKSCVWGEEAVLGHYSIFPSTLWNWTWFLNSIRSETPWLHTPCVPQTTSASYSIASSGRHFMDLPELFWFRRAQPFVIHICLKTRQIILDTHTFVKTLFKIQSQMQV